MFFSFLFIFKGTTHPVTNRNVFTLMIYPANNTFFFFCFVILERTTSARSRTHIHTTRTHVKNVKRRCIEEEEEEALFFFSAFQREGSVFHLGGRGHLTSWNGKLLYTLTFCCPYIRKQKENQINVFCWVDYCAWCSSDMEFWEVSCFFCTFFLF